MLAVITYQYQRLECPNLIFSALILLVQLTTQLCTLPHVPISGLPRGLLIAPSFNAQIWLQMVAAGEEGKVALIHK